MLSQRNDATHATYSDESGVHEQTAHGRFDDVLLLPESYNFQGLTWPFKLQQLRALHGRCYFYTVFRDIGG